jgi:hypothetical protein
LHGNQPCFILVHIVASTKEYEDIVIDDSLEALRDFIGDRDEVCIDNKTC